MKQLYVRLNSREILSNFPWNPKDTMYFSSVFVQIIIVLYKQDMNILILTFLAKWSNRRGNPKHEKQHFPVQVQSKHAVRASWMPTLGQYNVTYQPYCSQCGHKQQEVERVKVCFGVHVMNGGQLCVTAAKENKRVPCGVKKSRVTGCQLW